MSSFHLCTDDIRSRHTQLKVFLLMSAELTHYEFFRLLSRFASPYPFMCNFLRRTEKLWNDLPAAVFSINYDESLKAFEERAYNVLKVRQRISDLMGVRVFMGGANHLFSGGSHARYKLFQISASKYRLDVIIHFYWRSELGKSPVVVVAVDSVPDHGPVIDVNSGSIVEADSVPAVLIVTPIPILSLYGALKSQYPIIWTIVCSDRQAIDSRSDRIDRITTGKKSELLIKKLLTIHSKNVLQQTVAKKGSRLVRRGPPARPARFAVCYLSVSEFSTYAFAAFRVWYPKDLNETLLQRVRPSFRFAPQPSRNNVTLSRPPRGRCDVTSVGGRYRASAGARAGAINHGGRRTRARCAIVCLTSCGTVKNYLTGFRFYEFPRRRIVVVTVCCPSATKKSVFVGLLGIIYR
ncbi:hypothetical protein EVAR_15783_1 [Eumeta japonica]|uniref:Uncharacterized protein n=1 Tax=Eumeta variegata TaxID=151549 RepID=A0A4C1TZD9_EUMVA|nr:hypothetical protein EVAR_15783_1 [Eumeta japonica]